MANSLYDGHTGDHHLVSVQFSEGLQYSRVRTEFSNFGGGGGIECQYYLS